MISHPFELIFCLTLSCFAGETCVFRFQVWKHSGVKLSLCSLRPHPTRSLPVKRAPCPAGGVGQFLGPGGGWKEKKVVSQPLWQEFYPGGLISGPVYDFPAGRPQKVPFPLWASVLSIGKWEQRQAKRSSEFNIYIFRVPVCQNHSLEGWKWFWKWTKKVL